MTHHRGWIASMIGVVLLLSMGLALAQVRVEGYYRRDGTYGQPHSRTRPDSHPYNNYSFPGNYNPNTGKIAGGDPLKYLERYYRNNLSVFSAPTVAAADSPNTPNSTEFPDINGLTPLPDWVAPEEFARSRNYCGFIYGSNIA